MVALGSCVVAVSVNEGLGDRKTEYQKGRCGHCCLLQDTPVVNSLGVSSVHGIFWSCLLQCAKAGGRRPVSHSEERNAHPDLSCWQPPCLPPHCSQPAIVSGQGNVWVPDQVGGRTGGCDRGDPELQRLCTLLVLH